MISRLVGRQRTIRARQRALLRWYRAHGRHTLPWRQTRDPYGILVSEVMLQQTQVDRVIPYWTQWMERWPTMTTLARAKRASVIRAWAGLGYNRRAVYLHALAQEIVQNGWPITCGQTVPTTTPESTIVKIGVVRNHGGEQGTQREVQRCARALESLPGIGPYTANALLAFAWNLPAPCVDTNVRRVLAYAIYRRPAIMRMPIRDVMRLAARVIPTSRGREWNYALMDYGALVLRARDIPNRPTRASVPFHGSNRFWRGRIVAVLRESRRPMPIAVLRKSLEPFGDLPDVLHALIDALARDGVLARDRYGRVHIA